MTTEARFFDLSIGVLNIAGQTAGCPPVPMSTVVAHSFSIEELELRAKDKGTGLIVHRGEQVQVPGFRLIHSHTEISVVFSSSNDGHRQVSLNQIIDRLTGHKGLKSKRDICPILRHGGALNKRSLQFVISKLSGGRLVDENENCFDSYRELAIAGIGMPEALIIGLRGKEAGRPEVHPVLVDGLDALEPITRVRYPLQYEVHTYLKDDQSAAIKGYALKYFHTIRKRIAVDALSLFNSNDCSQSLLSLAA